MRFFYQDFIDVVLKYGCYIDLAKSYYLVLKMAITSFKNFFLLITFLDLYLIINIG